jgi:hypothetical protein
MPKLQIVIGARFTFIEVIRHLPRTRYGHKQWLCRCDCGAEIIASEPNLRRGDYKSCGCRRNELRREHATTHGQGALPEYSVWKSMLSRCRYGTRQNSQRYVGRGISVCKRWEKFENFFVDMGHRPSLAHSLDRFPNGAGDYEPDNCRWATIDEQTANKDNRILVEVGGREVFLVEAAQLLGVKYRTAYDHFRSGKLIGRRRNEAPRSGVKT